MSGSHQDAPPPEPPADSSAFPPVGQYDYVPGPGDAGYVEPEDDGGDPGADDGPDADFEDSQDAVDGDGDS